MRTPIRLSIVLIATGAALLSLADSAQAQRQRPIPFNVSGVGTIYSPLLTQPDVEFDAAGPASYLGFYRTTRSTLVVDLPADEPPMLNTPYDFFQADDPPFIGFRSVRGTLAFRYDAVVPGVVTVFDAGNGKLFAYFVATFTPVPEYSTGVFKRVTGGSFVMYAYTEPFTPGQEGVRYVWFGSDHLLLGRR